MSGNKRKTNTFWLVFSILLVLVVIIGGIGYLTNWFQSDIKTFYVEYEGRKIVRDCTGLKIEPGAEFKIGMISEDSEDYEVKIYASGTEETDFTFEVGEETYSWYNDVVKNEWEFTEYFGIEKEGNSFSLQKTEFEAILKECFPGKTVIGPEMLPEEVFRMEITVRKAIMKIGFVPYIEVTGITLPDKIVF